MEKLELKQGDWFLIDLNSNNENITFEIYQNNYILTTYEIYMPIITL